ncbi:MAG: hypothetical protein LUD68_09270, partial [Rikenellaceae bacterium]|nr:hypothetical protein [Rikenellaceae bacterium]
MLVLLPFSFQIGTGVFSDAWAVFGLVLLCGTGSLFRLAANPRVAVPDYFLAAFILYGITHIFLHPGASPNQYGLWEWGAALLLYVFLRRLTGTEKFQVLVFLVLSGSIQSLIALRQWFGWFGSNHAYFEITGSFGNPGQLGGYLAVCVVVCGGLFVQVKGSLKFRFTVLTAAVLIGLALLLFGSRAGWMAAAAGMGMVCG